LFGLQRPQNRVTQQQARFGHLGMISVRLRSSEFLHVSGTRIGRSNRLRRMQPCDRLQTLQIVLLE
jgi:hypothetical protein